jgi:hypothetical protein
LGIHINKYLKLHKPIGINLISTDTHPIKNTKIALDITKANEITIGNSKTGKVSAVVVITSIFGKKYGNSRSPNPGNLLIHQKNG